MLPISVICLILVRTIKQCPDEQGDKEKEENSNDNEEGHNDNEDNDNKEGDDGNEVGDNDKGEGDDDKEDERDFDLEAIAAVNASKLRAVGSSDGCSPRRNRYHLDFLYFKQVQVWIDSDATIAGLRWQQREYFHGGISFAAQSTVLTPTCKSDPEQNNAELIKFLERNMDAALATKQIAEAAESVDREWSKSKRNPTGRNIPAVKKTLEDLRNTVVNKDPQKARSRISSGTSL